MKPPFQLVTPDRLQIREGGGCMSIFGLPFFAAGVGLMLSALGVVPLSNASQVPALAWALLVVMGLAFTAVGGALAFGRSWTTLDRSQRTVIKQWGLLIPLRERTVPLPACTAVRLGVVAGDSDTADRYPVSLMIQGRPDLSLCDFSVYARARACARAVAAHLQLEVEDASTDHPVRLPAAQIDLPLHERMRRDGGRDTDVARPPGARIQVTREHGEVTVVIPARRLHGLGLAAGLIPLSIALVLGRPLWTFFRQSQTPDPVAWAFLGFLMLFFGIFPAMMTVSAVLRSRRGATIVAASRQGVCIRERGAWRTRVIASIDASDILDLDYSSRESSIASARRAAEQQALESYPSAATTISPRIERVMSALTRFVEGKGVTVKARASLTTFGQGLDDAESRYVYSVVRRALFE